MHRIPRLLYIAYNEHIVSFPPFLHISYTIKIKSPIYRFISGFLVVLYQIWRVFFRLPPIRSQMTLSIELRGRATFRIIL